MGNIFQSTYATNEPGGRLLRFTLSNPSYNGTTYEPYFSDYYIDRGDSNEDLFNNDVRRSHSAMVKVFVNEEALGNELAKISSANTSEYKLVIEEDTGSGWTIISNTYVIPKFTSSKINKQRVHEVTIRAKDGLKSLDGEFVPDDFGWTDSDTVTASTLIAELLSTTGFDLPIDVQQVWRPEGEAVTTEPLDDKIQLNNFSYKNFDDQIIRFSKGRVLDEVIGVWLGSEIVQSKGRWLIRQPDAFDSASLSGGNVRTWSYDASGVYQSNTTVNRTYDLSGIKWTQDKVNSKKPFRDVSLVYKHNTEAGLGLNGSFETFDNGQPEGWTFGGDWNSKWETETNENAVYDGSVAIMVTSDMMPKGVDVDNDNNLDPGEETSEAQTDADAADYALANLGEINTDITNLKLTIRGEINISGPFDYYGVYYMVELVNTTDSVDRFWDDVNGWTTNDEKHKLPFQTNVSYSDNEVTYTIPSPPIDGELRIRLYEGAARHTTYLSSGTGDRPPGETVIVRYDGIEFSYEGETTGVYQFKRFDNSLEGNTFSQDGLLGTGPFNTSPGAVKDSSSNIIKKIDSPVFSAPRVHGTAWTESVNRRTAGSNETIKITLKNFDGDLDPNRLISLEGNNYWIASVREKDNRKRLELIRYQDYAPTGFSTALLTSADNPTASGTTTTISTGGNTSNDSGTTGPSINDTDDLPEGTSNLYFTNGRVGSYITSNGVDYDDLNNVPQDIFARNGGSDGFNNTVALGLSDVNSATSGGTLEAGIFEINSNALIKEASSKVQVRNAADSAYYDLEAGPTSIKGDLTVEGDMTVQGNTTTINTTELTVEDNLITLNTGQTGSPTLDSGFEIERGTEPNKSFKWIENGDFFNLTGALKMGGGLTFKSDPTVITGEDDVQITLEGSPASSPQMFGSGNIAPTLTIKGGDSSSSGGGATGGLVQIEGGQGATSQFSSSPGGDVHIVGGLNSDFNNVRDGNVIIGEDKDGVSGGILDVEVESQFAMYADFEDEIRVRNTAYVDTLESDAQSFTSGVFGSGYRLTEDDGDGNSFFEVDNMRVRNTAYVDTLESDVQSFTSGVFGSGYRLTEDGGGGNSFFEVDNMRVRGEFRTHIFKKDIVRATNGIVYVSDAAEVYSGITYSTGGTFIPFYIKKGPDQATFQSGDLVRVKSISNDQTTISDVKLEITGISNDSNPDYTIYNTTVVNGGEVFVGDTAVRVGSTNTSSRDGSLLLDASTQFSPFIDVMDGVDSFAALSSSNKLKVRLGNLEGVTDTELEPSGYGLYTDNAFLKGQLRVGSSIFAADSGTSISGDDEIRISANGTGDGTTNYTRMYWANGSNWGIEGVINSSQVFWLGEDSGTTGGKIASFDFDENYISYDDDIFIGNNLQNKVGSNRVLVGNYYDGSAPVVRAQGPNPGDWVSLIGRSNPGDAYFRIDRGGQTRFEATSNRVSIDGSVIIGSTNASDIENLSLSDGENLMPLKGQEYFSDSNIGGWDRQVVGSNGSGVPLEDLGLSPGDTISLSVDLRTTGDQRGQLVVRTYNDSNTEQSNRSTGLQDTGGDWERIKINNETIPSSATRIFVGYDDGNSATSGTNYWRWGKINRGPKATAYGFSGAAASWAASDITKIDGGQIFTNSITASKLQIGNIKDIDGDAAVVSELFSGDYSDLSNTPTLGNVASLNEITSTYIANGTIVTADIAAGAITTNELAANAVTASEIDSNTITSSEIDTNNFYTTNFEMKSSGKITNDTGKWYIDKNGFHIENTNNSHDREKSYSIVDESDGSDVSAIYGTNGVMKFESFSNNGNAFRFQGNTNVNQSVIFDNSLYKFNVNVTGSADFFCDVDVNGNLNVDGQCTKNFRMDHPLDENRWLKHTTLEGPEAGVYQRGRLQGSTTITLPDYCKPVYNSDDVTVHLTPNGSYQELYVKSMSNTEIVVGIKNGQPEDIDCNWILMSTRADIDNYEVEPLKD